MNSTAIKNLGEIALRVRNLDDMRKFYASVVGLPVRAELEEPLQSF